ncbi:hypothetical protein ASPTUDRAFT_56092 [Aspergillus tubingensis CBS 134.48]|uniref:Uncharacterized protein n=1 Tax=Aspergillus tubingensis (strain CBS 134.48) TaxID=767770 RepID=A0A1L9N4D9_ASPTC|nr:hypothetical protein ASPTUDRAFT_56092 [Aspergillus tubingensis CBS 134.48]
MAGRFLRPVNVLSSTPSQHPFQKRAFSSDRNDWLVTHDGQMKRHGPTTLFDPIRLPRLSQTGRRFSFRASGEDNHLAQTGRTRD